jgi:hypothetical protein
MEITAELVTIVGSALGAVLWMTRQINQLEKRLNSKIEGVEKSLRGEINGVEKSLRGEINGLEKSLRGEINGLEKSLRGEIEHVAKEVYAMKAVLIAHGLKFPDIVPFHKAQGEK